MSGGNSGVESLPSKQMVAGSNPVPRSIVWQMATGIFIDATRDSSGTVLFQNWWVALAMAAFFAVCLLYTLLVVPVLKRKAAERSAVRVKRRPGRQPEGGAAPAPPDV